MKRRNRVLAVVLAAALSLSVGACGSSDQGTTNAGDKSAGNTEATVEQENDKQEQVDALASAKEKMADVANMNAKMVMEMDMEVSAEGETQSMQTVTTMDMSCFYDPMHFKVDTTVDAGEMGTTTQTIYAETDKDGVCTLYLTDGENWQSQTIESDALAQYDASSNMASYLDDSYHFEAAGTEQVDGANAYKYTGSISGDDMKETLRSSNALDSLSSLGVSAEQAESMLDDLGEISIDLWIDEASLYPVKYEMDMAKVMDTLMAKVMESMGDETEGFSMSVPKMKVSMTCSDYNEATEFSIPDEAKGK